MPLEPATERTGVILAGGNHPSLGWQWRPGVPMLAQAQRILKRAGVGQIVVSGSDYSGQLSQPGQPIADRPAGRGPLGGLASVVRQQSHLAGHCLIVVPIDMPAMNAHALKRLAEIAELHGRGARFDLGPLPLALINAPDLIDSIEDALHCGGALHRLGETLELPVLASMPDDGLDNPATMEELDQIRQRVDTEKAAALP